MVGILFGFFIFRWFKGTSTLVEQWAETRGQRSQSPPGSAYRTVRISYCSAASMLQSTHRDVTSVRQIVIWSMCAKPNNWGMRKCECYVGTTCECWGYARAILPSWYLPVWFKIGVLCRSDLRGRYVTWDES